jgi:sugar lactone lactonase YvrE
VYRVAPDGTPEQVASDLGVACGIAFDEDGWMFVGDRSGTIFRVRDGSERVCRAAAKRGRVSPGDESGKRAARDGAYARHLRSIYKLDRRGQITTIASSLGRPQGITFGPDGQLYVIDALAGSSGLHRWKRTVRSRQSSRAGRWWAWHSARAGADRRLQRDRLPL